MKIIDLDQNTPEWLKWREGGLGASDAPTILNENPYESPYALWRRKTGRTGAKTQTAAMAHGKNTEQAAREAYSAETGEFMPPVCGVHDEYDWMRASFDGMNGKVILEVKCPTELQNHLSAREGSVPDHYFAQVQHQLAVSGAELCHFWSFFDGKGALVEVKPAEVYIQDMIAIEKEFWRWVMEDVYPMPEGTLDLSDDRDAVRWAEEWVNAKRALRLMEETIRRLETEGKRHWFGKNKKIICGPLEANWTHRKGYTEKEPRTVGESLSCTFKVRG